MKIDIKNWFYIPVLFGGLIFVQTIWAAQSGKIVGWGDQQIAAHLSGKAVKIAANYYYSAALNQDGSVTVWGDCPANMLSPNTGLIDVSAGFLHCLGLKADNSIVVWGDNSYHLLSFVSGRQPFRINAKSAQMPVNGRIKPAT